MKDMLLELLLEFWNTYCYPIWETLLSWLNHLLAFLGSLLQTIFQQFFIFGAFAISKILDVITAAFPSLDTTLITQYAGIIAIFIPLNEILGMWASYRALLVVCMMIRFARKAFVTAVAAGGA